MVVQQKTGRLVPFEITEPTRVALAALLMLNLGRADDWLFPSRSRPGSHITTRQYARLVDAWVAAVDLPPAAYGTHSLRRTKVALIYKKTGNLRACQLLLGHGKLESTVRYLGIEVDDALELSEQLDLWIREISSAAYVRHAPAADVRLKSVGSSSDLGVVLLTILPRRGEGEAKQQPE